MARKRTTIPTKPEDARAQRSIEALGTAFLGLLEIKQLEDVSLKEITHAAGVSYPTFFRRFANKQQLLESIAADEIRHFLQLGEDAVRSNILGETTERMCQYIQSHRKLWETLLNNASAAMREEFMRVSRQMGDSRPKLNPWMPMDLSVSFITSGFFEVLAWWMRQPADYPVENVVVFLDELILKHTARRRDVQLRAYPADCEQAI